ncbi:10548_t:CDS:1, partial [Gigaspora rosea]
QTNETILSGNTNKTNKYPTITSLQSCVMTNQKPQYTRGGFKQGTKPKDRISSNETPEVWRQRHQQHPNYQGTTVTKHQ